MTTNTPSLYEEAKAAGLVLGNHESDLHLKDTPEARELCVKHRAYMELNSALHMHKGWLDVPFRYEPYWIKKASGTVYARYRKGIYPEGRSDGE